MEFFVNRPGYGNKPIKSGTSFSKEIIDRSHWRYSSVKYFPETAIEANIEKQNYALYPRKLYVDIAIQCDVCKRMFIFFALEQKYWFEELEFYIDAHCTRCIECRKNDQEIRFMQKRYQTLIASNERTVQETNDLKNIALELYQLGYIRNINKINAIR
ncbi:MAG: zinc-ribbon domain-containing protein [Pseudomonadota bacterium]